MRKNATILFIMFLLLLTASYLIAQSSPSKVGTTDDDRGINYNNGPCIDRTPDGTVMCIWGTKTNHNAAILWTTYDDLFETWNPPQFLGNGIAERATPALIADDNYHFHAVWTNNNYRLNYSQYDGFQWSTPVQVPNTNEPWNSINANKSSIVIDSNGNIWIAWSTYRQNDDINEFLYTCHSADGGATWSDPDTLTKKMHPGIISTYFAIPHLAVGPNGRVGVTYREKDTDISANYQLFLQEYNGSEWSDPELVSFFHDSVNCYQASLAYDSKGKRHIVFYTNETDWSSVTKGQIYYTSKAEGESWSVPVPISADPNGIADYPAISVGPNDALYVTFLSNDYTTGSGVLQVFVVTSNNGGASWSEAVNLSNADVAIPLRSPSIGKHVREAGVGGTTFAGGADIFWVQPDAAEVDGFSMYYGRIPWVEVTNVTAHQATKPAPDSPVLYQNYPNPFNPKTQITFNLNKKGHVRLSIINLQGQIVAQLLDASKDAGTHHLYWNGVDHLGQPVTSGLYFYQLKVDNQTLTKKMSLLR